MDRPISTPYRKKWKWGIILLVLIFLAGYGLVFIKQDGGAVMRVNADRLIIAEVRLEEFQESISLLGQVQSLRSVYLDLVQGGIVEERYVEEGTILKTGDPIVRLSNTQLLLDIMYRQSQLFDQMNNLHYLKISAEQNRMAQLNDILDLNRQVTKAERQKNTQEQLSVRHLIPVREFEDFMTDYDYLVAKRKMAVESFHRDSVFRVDQIEQLTASLKYMERNLELARKNLNDLVVRAPMDGQLTSLKAEIGESMAPGARIGQIDLLEQFKVRADIDEYYISRIKKGQSARIRFDSSSYRLVIERIFPEVRSGKFQVDLQFVGEFPRGIRRGQSMHIDLLMGDRRTSLQFEKGAFYQYTGGHWIFVLDSSGHSARRRSIRIGRQNPDSYELLEGLQAGDKVIISGYENWGHLDKLIIME
ncbi:MAG: HlyD family efflux transporter periplasmic adaptor subunit [Candidatus Delongbacteria bacterium]|nr:HlyD family efflux transporter periplasmic adaptor subunit [Candidatus Delongbacteria bacterium]